MKIAKIEDEKAIDIHEKAHKQLLLNNITVQNSLLPLASKVINTNASHEGKDLSEVVPCTEQIKITSNICRLDKQHAHHRVAGNLTKPSMCFSTSPSIFSIISGPKLSANVTSNPLKTGFKRKEPPGGSEASSQANTPPARKIFKVGSVFGVSFDQNHSRK